MNGFLKATFTLDKFQGLFINTALGNFAGYVAGSLVTLASTRHVLERRSIGNLFGLRPRKQMVVHVLPHWLEWLLALIVGFLVMEAVRYWFNRRKYAELLSARPQQRTALGGEAGDNPSRDCRPLASAAASPESKCRDDWSKASDDPGWAQVAISQRSRSTL